MNSIDMSAAANRVATSLARTSTTNPAAPPPAVSSRLLASSATPLATGTTGATGAAPASTSTSTSDQITANDFLTLLVTEMKNQDPTQPTDPNSYIQQMVSVNSLQQLIAINNDLTPPAAPSTPAPTPAAVSPVSGVTSAASTGAFLFGPDQPTTSAIS